jgi:hypothetical protein
VDKDARTVIKKGWEENGRGFVNEQWGKKKKRKSSTQARLQAGNSKVCQTCHHLSEPLVEPTHLIKWAHGKKRMRNS